MLWTYQFPPFVLILSFIIGSYLEYWYDQKSYGYDSAADKKCCHLISLLSFSLVCYVKVLLSVIRELWMWQLLLLWDIQQLFRKVTCDFLLSLILSFSVSRICISRYRWPWCLRRSSDRLPLNFLLSLFVWSCLSFYYCKSEGRCKACHNCRASDYKKCCHHCGHTPFACWSFDACYVRLILRVPG